MSVHSSLQNNEAETKNIWIAAGEGDLERVRHLVDREGLLPTVPDPFTYTPIHAAASYSQNDTLRFLLSHPSTQHEAANIIDSDGDTPLFVCENVATARILIEEYSADPHWKNSEGITPAAAAQENEHESLADYLRSLTGEVRAPSPHNEVEIGDEVEEGGTGTDGHGGIDTDADVALDTRTERLMARCEGILARAAERQNNGEGGNNDSQSGAVSLTESEEEELRSIVGEEVLAQLREGQSSARGNGNRSTELGAQPYTLGGGDGNVSGNRNIDGSGDSNSYNQSGEEDDAATHASFLPGR